MDQRVEVQVLGKAAVERFAQEACKVLIVDIDEWLPQWRFWPMVV